MKRRKALINMALAVGGMMVLPSCDRWTTESVELGKPFLAAKENELLAEIVGTIIPHTDTPGAKELNVHTFIQKMLEDCYEKEVQQNVIKGLDQVEKRAEKQFSKSFGECNEEQRTSLLQAMEEGEDKAAKDCYTVIKKLTIHGYLTSEYVMTHHMNYKMAPGFFKGCVPVSPQA